MDWVKVAVFAEESQEGLARIQTALGLTSARLALIAAVAQPALPHGYDPGGFVWEAFRREADAAVQTAADRLRALAEQFHAHAHRLERQQLVVGLAHAARASAALARTADAVILPQPNARQSAMEREVMTGALMASGRPCLLLPRWTEPRALKGPALIAWKGAPEAARAVRDALPLLKRANRVRILCASDGHDLDGEGKDGLERLAAWLSLHGVRVEPPAITAPPDEITADIGGAILADAAAFGAELLVMGGFGHARLAERVFGGATQKVLHQANCALLLSH